MTGFHRRREDQDNTWEEDQEGPGKLWEKTAYEDQGKISGETSPENTLIS